MNIVALIMVRDENRKIGKYINIFYLKMLKIEKGQTEKKDGGLGVD